MRPASATSIAEYSNEETRTRAYALQRLAANLGFSFGPAIGGVLATIDYQLLFWVDALTTLAGAALMLAYFRMRETTPAKSDAREHKGRQSPLFDKTFLLFLFVTFFVDLVFVQFFTTYPLYLREHFQFSKPQIGLMFAVNTGVIVLFEMLLIEQVKHRPALPTIAHGCFWVCLGFGILPLGSSAAFAILSMVILTIGEMLTFPISTSFVAHRGKRGDRTMYLCWHTLMFSFATVLGPILGTRIYQIEPDWIWFASLATGIISYVAFRALARRVSHEESALTSDQ